MKKTILFKLLFTAILLFSYEKDAAKNNKEKPFITKFDAVKMAVLFISILSPFFIHCI